MPGQYRRIGNEVAIYKAAQVCVHFYNNSAGSGVAKAGYILAYYTGIALALNMPALHTY